MSAADWWRSHKQVLTPDPEVLQSILQLLTSVASSAGVERVFSSFGLVQSKLRNQLGTDKASKLVFLYKFLNPWKLDIRGTSLTFLFRCVWHLVCSSLWTHELTFVSVLSMVCVVYKSQRWSCYSGPFRCYERAVYDCAIRQLSWLRNWMFHYFKQGATEVLWLVLYTVWISELNHSWNSFKQCMFLCLSLVFFLFNLTKSLIKQAAMI